jgi:hypothetical protein
MQLSDSLFALLFMLWPVILLAFDATVSNEIASCTFLQFYVIISGDATGSTTHHIV